MEATLEYAGSHLPKLLQLVANEEEVVLRDGDQAVARIVPFRSSQPPRSRPPVGTITSGPIRNSADAFAPLDDDWLTRSFGLAPKELTTDSILQATRGEG